MAAIEIWLPLGEGGLSNSWNDHCRVTNLPFYQPAILLPACVNGGIYSRVATSQVRRLLEEICMVLLLLILRPRGVELIPIWLWQLDKGANLSFVFSSKNVTINFYPNFGVR